MAPQPRSILVYIGSSADDALGENMIKLPFLWALRDAFPDARITWIPGFGPAQFDGILKSLTQGLIHEVVTDLYLGTGPLALLSRRQPLAGREFDLIIDTQKMPVRTLLLRRVPHQRFVSSTWGYVLSDAKPPADVPAPRLLIDKLLALVAAAGGRAIRPDHHAPVPADCREAALAMLPEGPVYVGFAPGAGRKDTGKCWPLDRMPRAAQEDGFEVRAQLVKVFVPDHFAVFIDDPVPVEEAKRGRQPPVVNELDDRKKIVQPIFQRSAG